jgi:hypothetical protein
LEELDIQWIPAQFGAGQRQNRAQLRYCTRPAGEGLRVVGAKALAQANAYLENEFLPWWN